MVSERTPQDTELQTYLGISNAAFKKLLLLFEQAHIIPQLLIDVQGTALKLYDHDGQAFPVSVGMYDGHSLPKISGLIKVHDTVS